MQKKAVIRKLPVTLMLDQVKAPVVFNGSKPETWPPEGTTVNWRFIEIHPKRGVLYTHVKGRLERRSPREWPNVKISTDNGGQKRYGTYNVACWWPTHVADPKPAFLRKLPVMAMETGQPIYTREHTHKVINNLKRAYVIKHSGEFPGHFRYRRMIDLIREERYTRENGGVPLPF